MVNKLRELVKSGAKQVHKTRQPSAGWACPPLANPTRPAQGLVVTEHTAHGRLPTNPQPLAATLPTPSHVAGIRGSCPTVTARGEIRPSEAARRFAWQIGITTGDSHGNLALRTNER
jgi:hypothetical protein